MGSLMMWIREKFFNRSDQIKMARKFFNRSAQTVRILRISDITTSDKRTTGVEDIER